MAKIKIKGGVYFVGAIDWDRRLFDELIPLPDGTSYNAYIIKGSEKIALIDTVDPSKTYELMTNLNSLNIEKIDYIIANHAEQDHSGSIPNILERYPMAKIVTNEKCKTFLTDLLHLPEDAFITIKEGEKLSLGGKTLEFIFTPWVHWPETMSTYLIEDKILFSCDFFGSHFATSCIFAKEGEKLLEDAKRYYAEIMMPFRGPIKNNLKKLENYEIDMIAPSHGPIYKNPDFIINAYKEWISDSFANTVLIPYVSMHDSTKKIVEYLTDALIDKKIYPKLFNLTKTDTGEITMALVDAPTLILATPMVLNGAHPLAAYAAYLVNAIRPKLKFISMVGSYGWGGKSVDQIKSLMTNIKAEFIEPVIIKGLPKKSDLEKLDELVNTIYNKHKDLNLL